jgi:SAM-dependent methyltransferase
VASVEEHYEKLLARHYSWMRGDYDSKVRESLTFFEEAGISPRSGGRALDLGCGSGFQSMALAELGFVVLSVDTSSVLLEELRSRAGKREIQPLLGDIRDPGVYAAKGPFEVAVCMGDTLTHLETAGEIEALVGDVRGAMEEGGTLIFEFRDYTEELKGADRSIPVRMEDARIMATFLEYEADHVNVHDMVFEKGAHGWEAEKSVYRKLRLGTEDVAGFLERAGFRVVSRGEDGGFVRIVARTR